MSEASSSSGGARPKPWHRPRNIALATLLAVLLVAAWLFYETWAVYTAEAGPRVDHYASLDCDAREMAGVTEAEGSASWEKLQNVLQLAERVEQDVQRLIIADGFESRGDWDNGLIEYAYLRERTLSFAGTRRERRALDALRAAGVFDLLGDYAAGPVGIPIRPADVGPMPEFMPELPQARALVKARAASMRLALLEGDWGDVVAAFDQQLAIAQTLSHHPAVINRLVAAAIQSLATLELRHELTEAELDAATCDALLASLDRRRLAPVTLALDGERAALFDLIQQCFSDDGDGGGYLLPDAANYFAYVAGAEGTMFDAAHGRFLHADRVEMTRLANRYFDGCAALAVMPAGAPAESRFDEESFRASLSEIRHSFLALMVGTLGRTIQNTRVVESQVEGTRLLVAIERYRAEHGAFPDDLAALAPGIIRVVPLDPLNGMPFGYRRLAEDLDGREFVLYTYGYDRVDNGGAAHPEYPHHALTGKGPGLDYVLNELRPDLEE